MAECAVLQRDETEDMERAWKDADVITDRLDELGMRCECADIHVGPQVISYDMIASEKIAVRKLPVLAPELAYELGSESVVINAPKPGTKFVTIEIANPNRQLVTLKDVIHAAESPLTVPLGISPDNKIISHSIKNMPHLLVGGTTGSGKSSGLNSLICSLLLTTTPDELQFMLFDTKQVELTVYEGIKNLITPVVTDPFEAVIHFKALVGMMDKRYKFAQEMGAKSLDELNEKLIPYGHKIPYLLVVVDEIADLMFLSKHEVEESITRIAGKARAVGIHLVLATQSPRREVISGLLKSNLPSRLAFATSSPLDSRIILDKMGAESLLGAGDAMFSDQGKAPVRLQSPFVSSDEIEYIVNERK
jgi:DNA segregation ATPase FtsK/SpoIIIE, S-DNA-T family